MKKNNCSISACFNTALILLLLFCFSHLIAQTPFNYSNIKFERIYSENIKIEKGLSQNNVYSIIQDRIGFMWFGTWDGLNKFDGYNYKIWKSVLYNKSFGLSNETIYSLYEDKDGLIWIGTESGLNMLNRKTGKIMQFKYNPSNKKNICNDTIRTITEDADGFIWIGTQNGLDKIDKTSGKIFHYYHSKNNQNSISSNIIFNLFIDNQKTLWIATTKGLNKYNPISNNFVHYVHDIKNRNEGISNDTVWSVCQDKFGFLWLGTNNGLNKFNITTGKFVHYFHNAQNVKSVCGNQIKRVFEDSKGVLWVGSDGNGLDIFERSAENFIHYKYNSGDNYSISNDVINAIYEDKAGIIWVCSGSGLNKIDMNSNKFRHYHSSAESKNSMNCNVVWSLLKDEKDCVWIGTETGGINLFDTKKNSFSFLMHDPNNTNSLASNNIRYIFKDKNGAYWIGTYESGLDKFYKGKFIHYKVSTGKWNSINIEGVNYIIQDRSGFIWLGTYGGLCKLDPKTNKMTTYRNHSNDPYSLSNDIIFSITEDSKNNIWVGTYGGGISVLNKKTNKFKIYKHSYTDTTSLSNNRIFSVYEDRDGFYWIGTMGGGLNKFDPRTGKFKIYTENEGLSNNVVYAALEDKDGNLWISTNGGISKFNKKKETFVNYDVKEGVQSNEFNSAAAFQSSNGEMFFGGMNGFNAFFPEEIKKNTHVPRIVITAFKVFNNTVHDECFGGDTIVLKHSDNFFSFEFSALDFTNPAKNRYAYKLENIDRRWIYTDANRRYAEYTNLSPGTYIFKVKGSNNDGVWNDEGIAITIIIRPPWWATWSFRISTALLLIVLIVWIVSIRMRQMRRKHEVERKMLDIEKQLFELEQKALRLQMNPHFIFNSLNSIQSFILSNDTDKAISYMAKFSQLMRLILTNSRESFIPVKDEMKGLQYYLDIEQLRFDNKFDYSIHIDKEIDDEFMGIPPMIMQPYVENAVLHGIINKKSKGHISVSLKLENKIIFCVIEDDGVGRERAMQIKNESGLKHKSRGMVITKERLEILNKQNKNQITVNVIDLMDDSDNPKGTRVEINIPYKDV